MNAQERKEDRWMGPVMFAALWLGVGLLGGIGHVAYRVLTSSERRLAGIIGLVLWLAFGVSCWVLATRSERRHI